MRSQLATNRLTTSQLKSPTTMTPSATSDLS
jgi:hypothetical protein